MSAATVLPETAPGRSPRIARLLHRYQTTTPTISIERARLFTEGWTQTEGRGVSPGRRVALAMRNVYQGMTIYLDRDDRIAGTWTERFLGIPIDIERGVFNDVLASELTRGSLLRARARSLGRGASYVWRKRAVGEFVRNQRLAGPSPLNTSMQTMQEREINAFAIEPSDRRELLDTLLPYWHGRTLVDRVEAELESSGLSSPDMRDFVMAMFGSTSRQVSMLSSCATVATLQGHVILDFDRVIDRGLIAMTEEVEARLAETEDAEQADFLRSLLVALEGVSIFATRLAQAVERQLLGERQPERKAALREMLFTCRAVPFRPARTFREAVQALWTIKTAVEIAHPVNLHCFGRLDQTLNPFYERDLAAGVITEEAASELLEELLLKLMSQNLRPESNLLGNFYHRYLGSTPVTVGGLTPEGEDGTNPTTYLFVRAAHRAKAVTNLSVRIHRGTPDALLERVAENLHDGTSSYALYNDEVTVEAMRRRGFSLEDARDYALMGCVEATCPGKTGSMSANALLLSRLLDITLRNGDAKTLAGTIHGEGPPTGDPDGFESFDQLLEALYAQASFAIDKIVRGSNLRDQLFAEHLPAPYISAFMDGCLTSRRDVTAGGATYDLSGISMINSLANLVDSLVVIQRLVFEQKLFTMAELRGALDDNFVGHDAIKRAIDALPGKWGNGDPKTDALAAEVAGKLFALTHGHRSYKDAPFVVYLISMITHTIDGRMSMATPDGRPAATPYAASGNPYNVERAGVTATLRSVAALPWEETLGCAINLKLHPTGVGENPAARAKWAALLRTYFQLGGAQLQPTVVSGEMLRAAQSNPEDYRDLIIKVGGYSTYFVDLGREIQDEIVSRTEHR